MRVLKWIIDRVNSRVDASDGTFGLVPKFEDINWEGLDFNTSDFDTLIKIPKEEGIKAEVVSDKDYEVRREPSGKLVHVYKDGRVLPAH